ncbi:MAG: hypothetical protein ACREBT_01260 [Thermoplasmata archaeon]
MPGRLRTRRWTMVAVVGALFVVGLASTLAPALASTSTAPTAASTTLVSGTAWSYGNVATENISLSGPFGGDITGSITYGFVANLTETNLSANTTELYLQETIGVSLSIQDCRINCTNLSGGTGAAPVELSTYSYRAYQTYQAWTNLTNQANVTEMLLNHTTEVVPAIGILSSHSTTSSSINESTSNSFALTPLQDRSFTANATYLADSEVDFVTPLGILPLGNASPSGHWSSSARYNSTSSWGVTWSLDLSGVGVLTGNESHSSSETLALAVLSGSAGSAFVRLHELRALPVTFGLTGGLDMVGGLALEVNAPSPFSGSFGGRFVFENSEIGNVDFGNVFENPTESLAEPVSDASAQFSTQLSDANDNGLNYSFGNNSVNGSPMTPEQAGATSGCLQAATCVVGGTTTGGLGPGASIGPAGAWLLWGAVAVASVVVVLAVVVARNRRLPPPRYPNAALYPPGPQTAPAEATSPRSSAERAPPTDDPLDRLW